MMSSTAGEQKKRILVAGDSCLVVEFGTQIKEDINREIRQFTAYIHQQSIQGIMELVPTFCSVMVCYDPSVVSYRKLVRQLKRLLNQKNAIVESAKRIIEIPVCYEEEFGIDLPSVSAHTGLSTTEIIKRHSQTDYLIYMLGFLPGFAYLGGLDPSLFTPRLTNPRSRIKAGAVGIGGEQTGIYPLDSPGGWQLIGQTPVRPYQPQLDPPILYQAGDFIRFKPITALEYRQIEALVQQQNYHCNRIEQGDASTC
ncbi:5-oxoprolinase subunit PxpB [Lachnospiraceae bacterium ZAX-1]